MKSIKHTQYLFISQNITQKNYKNKSNNLTEEEILSVGNELNLNMLVDRGIVK